MKKLVFATNNSHKLEEVRALLREAGPEIEERFEILSLADIGCDVDIPETGMTFYDNALQKAEYVKVHYNLDCFADDSGLEVRALGMEPGVRSARYADDAGFTHNSDANMDKLLRNMTNIKERQAQFRAVIVLLMDGKRLEFEGVCRGEITRERSGSKGFGYDPVFVPEGHTVTFAEMAMEDKNVISHRGKAVRQLVKYLSTLE
jgi:XTP/dITP diphosphohydrolase